ncbi:MAG TPA: glycerol-3-phosphate 1-O-acyltransferase PlsY [Reyranella sp.]|nr:glycerol-3-phosphate 1-O-acyltransferase PlsY [Reyranella sp.]
MPSSTIAILAAAVGGYLLGSIPFGLLLTKAVGLGDIRSIGSGNIGATNVLRTGNKKLAAAVLVLDMLKGFAAVMIAAMWGPYPAIAAAWGALLGHMFPVWLGFKGGKGVATKLGVLWALSWPIGLISSVAWLLVAAVFRYSSLASLLCTAIGAAAAWYFDAWPMALAITLMVPLVWYRHHQNLSRLLKGTEPKIGQGK